MNGRPKRALLLTPTSPWGGSFGAQQRTALLYDSLNELLPVDILLLEEGGDCTALRGDRPEILAKLSWTEPSVTVYKYAVNRWVNRWCHENIDWTRYSIAAGRYLTPMTKIDWPAHLRTLLDCDDASYRYAPSNDSLMARAAAEARGIVRSWQTKIALKRYDHVFFCSPRDQRLFAPGAGSILPNVVPEHPQNSSVGSAEAASLLIVGSMWYAPNRLGVEWFLRDCWPAIAARCPGLTLRIVGPAPAELRERWERSPRTEAPGFVDSLSAEYARAMFAVAPIHYGGGTCIKFLEAAAYRRACVITPRVLGGFEPDFEDGGSTLVASNANEMVERCARLWEHRELRDSIAEKAHRIVTERYSVARFKAVVRTAAQRLLSAP